MPEGAELQIKTGQRGLLIASYKRVEKRLMGHGFCRAGSPYNCTLGTARVPVSDEILPPAHSTLNAAELPQAKKVCIYACRATLVVSNSLQPCGLPGFSVREGVSRQEYWSVLASTGLHTLLEHYISCCPSCQPP